MGSGRSGKKRSGKPSSSKAKGQKKPAAKSPKISAKAEDPKNLESECKNKNQEGHQIHDAAASRPGDRDETLSNQIAHSRKRGNSLPSHSVDDNTEAALNTRSEAVTLLRARTLSRLSESDQPSQELLQAFLEKKPSSSEGIARSEGPRDTMVYENASLMDYVTNKPKKNNKSKKKGKKAASESNASVEEQTGDSSKIMDSSVSLPYREKDTVMEEASGGLALATDEKMIQEHPTNVPEDKGKGKQRVEELASNEDATQSSAQPSTAEKKPDTDQAVTDVPKTPELTRVKDPEASCSSSSQQSSRGRADSVKQKPPSIKEGQVQQESVSESPVLPASTPESSGTASTSAAWTSISNPDTQLSPQTTAPSAPSTGHRSKPASKASDNATTCSASQAITSHAHPSPSSNRNIQEPRAKGGRAITKRKSEGFYWQLDSHGFSCSKANCEKRCNLWDGATVICPKCGPFSETRYCSRKHLFEDIKAHWPICGQLVFKHPCKESTIPKSVQDGPPLVPCLHPYDTPERHRQAVHLNMNTRAGDYFIFSDWEDHIAAGFPKQNVALRCSSRIIHVVNFTDPKEKDRFRRVLAACLFVTIEATQLTDYLFRLIRDNLRNTNAINANTNTLYSLEASLKYQMYREFAITIQPSITGERHACPTDWTGRNRRTCRDEVCRGEHQRLLGSLGGHGHESVVNDLEMTYWVLRAARVTHPTVENARDRMRGEGFDDVADEDRRVFCRGDGWDGARSGAMEIEGKNDF
ncbi:hypothetical protein BDW62DRAFT_219060 [Aspergillus aurantiobrunneus]